MGINPQARAIEHSSILGQEIVFRRQLEQNRSTGGDRKAGITTPERVANPVRFILVEDDGLVGFRDGLRATHVVQVDPAVRKYEVRGGNVFLVAPVLAGAWTCDVPDGCSFGHQKRAGIEIGHWEMPRRFERRRTTKPLRFARHPSLADRLSAFVRYMITIMICILMMDII